MQFVKDPPSKFHDPRFAYIQGDADFALKCLAAAQHGPQWQSALAQCLALGKLILWVVLPAVRDSRHSSPDEVAAYEDLSRQLLDTVRPNYQSHPANFPQANDLVLENLDNLSRQLHAQTAFLEVIAEDVRRLKTSQQVQTIKEITLKIA